MTDSTIVAVDTPDGDLSIIHSSPRMESSATTSTACINDIAQTLRRGLSQELLCPLCDHLFDRPVMVTCGHSYCEPCIERHTRDTRSCVICKHDVGPFEAMIPSITLDNMVKKLKNEDIGETSYEDSSFTSEDKVPKEIAHHKNPQQQNQQNQQQPPLELISPPKLIRTMSQKRRLFFSIAAPTICSSPITPHRRRPLSPSARPTKSSLKIPPESLDQQSLSPESSSHHENEANKSQNDSIIAGATNFLFFRRHGFGRRSERFTSATQASLDEVDEEDLDASIRKDSEDVEKKLDENPPKMKRNSFLRRSLNAFRRSGRGPRRQEASEDTLALISEDVEHQNPESPENPTVKDKKSNMKSLWKRLFVSSKKSEKAVQLIRHDQKDDGSFSPSFIRLQNQHDDPPESRDLKMPGFALGYYMGIGRKFERIAGGSEICVVVFGHAVAGKTTLVRGIRKLFLEGTDRIRVIPLAERYRLAGIGMMPYPEGDNRLPHIVSMVIQSRTEEGLEYVLDIIDPEYDNSTLPQAYMDACDAAFLLIDGRNCASLLSAHQIYRNMKGPQHAHVQSELIKNIPSETSSQPHVISSNEMLETSMAKTMTPAREMCATQLKREDVEEMLITICERVTMARRKPSSSTPASQAIPTTPTTTTTVFPKTMLKSKTP